MTKVGLSFYTRRSNSFVFQFEYGKAWMSFTRIGVYMQSYVNKRQSLLPCVRKPTLMHSGAKLGSRRKRSKCSQASQLN